MVRETTQGSSIHVTGVVQGVGFRPFIYGLAQEYSLAGWVRNTSAGVEIALDGSPLALESFTLGLRNRSPPLARIDQVRIEKTPPGGFTTFEILPSYGAPEGFQPISPDVGVCPDCLSELFDPHDRRFRYPFINCTNCGPRFTIITDIPYDRPSTTMTEFEMCSACRQEYEDPLDRRFHAQPVACPECGPQIWLEPAGSATEEALKSARKLLKAGLIVAIKGLGGFHLACDATSQEAVRKLRSRKLRVDKPFALMMPDIETVERHCYLGEEERALLQDSARPIVLLRRHPLSTIDVEVAPNQDNLGVMLPYTPLHFLLLEPHFPEALVMTSGNLSEEPIVTGNTEARERLGEVADAFLMHDREIQIRCDDPVVRVNMRSSETETIYPVRRGRGYAPAPIQLPWNLASILATGGELKNTVCLTKDHYAFLSQHIGNLENYETLVSFEETIAHFEHLFRLRPEVVAHDLHPDYLATRYALKRADEEGLEPVGVQHHHAHIASCMAEHALPADRPVIGVAFDGTGYGTDGTIWGGEFLVADYETFRRAYWLRPVPLPGGDSAIRHPWRMALAWLDAAGLPWEERLDCVQAASEIELSVVRNQIDTRTNAPLTTSMGRLFDAVASLARVRQSVNYEAQAAIELEALVDPDEHCAYPFELGDGPIDVRPALEDMWLDLESGISPSIISARFHNGVAQMVKTTCEAIRRWEGLENVALSGGVWQNMTLLHKSVSALETAGFTVYIHRQVPANDGGLALGQAVVAHHSLSR
jgi:hydrogenase maturation protein HypF